MFEEISKVIRSSKDIVILPHKRADGDCLGSAFALLLMLRSLGKNAEVILEEKNPKIFSILCGTEPGSEIEREITPDLAIAVDCGDMERLGKRKDLFVSARVTANIDHHPTNTRFADYNCIDASAAATGQILFGLMEYMKIPLTKEIANNLYTALSSDTGRFAYANTDSKIHIIAAKLHEAGADHVGINEFLFEKNTLSKIMLMRDALNSFEIFSGGKIASVSVTRQQITASGVTDDDMNGLINIPRSLETVQVAVCFKELTDENAVDVSFRSNTIDVAEIAKKFGGGGHIRASGCTIAGDLKDIKKTVISEIIKVM
ncbi:MAG: Bifunctional oligoribonuclease and PAP phosphatase NrnA [Firmicutes bacterium ADurb.Bin193]|nr:MAG: Bifunctional oligoribonuclease and PAP phosphatase NrnA [Firmicutes bacterium ADurb.Bin193]